MPQFPVVGGETQDLAKLARSLRTALLVVDAAIPLPVRLDEPPWAYSGLQTADILADRTALRSIAFRMVLRELNEFEYTVRPDDMLDLAEGRLPATEGD